MSNNLTYGQATKATVCDTELQCDNGEPAQEAAHAPPQTTNILEKPLSEDALLKIIYTAGITAIAVTLIITAYLVGVVAFGGMMFFMGIVVILTAMLVELIIEENK